MAQLLPAHAHADMSAEFNLDSIPRSASYTQFPATTGPDASFERDVVKRTFSENLIANPKTNTFRHASIKKGAKRSNDLDGHQGRNGLLRRLSTHSKSGPQITISGFQLGGGEDNPNTGYQPTLKKYSSTTSVGAKSRSVSGSLARLKRQSWIASSRSPSPSKRKPSERRPNSADGDVNRASPSPMPSSSVAQSQSATSNVYRSGRIEQDKMQRKKSRRPISAYLSMTNLSDANSKRAVIPKALSTDRLPIYHAHTSSEKPPSLPSSKSFERLNAFGADSPRRKDDLWNAFRSLDADFQKYAISLFDRAKANQALDSNRGLAV